MEWLKSLWAKWSVHLSVVGGVLVIATAYGTCTYEPPAGAVSEATTPAPATTPAVEVSATTTGTTDDDGAEDNTTGSTPTTVD